MGPSSTKRRMSERNCVKRLSPTNRARGGCTSGVNKTNHMVFAVARLPKVRVKEIFEDLVNRMRVATSEEEVKAVVSLGQDTVDAASGPARDRARKLQKKLAKFGENKLSKIGVVKKGLKISGHVPGVGGSVSRFEEKSEPPKRRRPRRKEEKML